MRKQGFVSLLASGRNGTLYVGVTSDLARRIWEHRTADLDGFTKAYHIHRLVHVEAYDDIRDAIAREKQIKKWNRAWKLRLIERKNPQWTDLYEQLNGSPGFPPARE